jgi:hypothetical protein
MTEHSHPRLRARILPVGVIAVIIGHGVVAYHLSKHLMLPAAVVSGATVLVVIKHLGWFRSALALFRRRTRRNAPVDDR